VSSLVAVDKGWPMLSRLSVRQAGYFGIIYDEWLSTQSQPLLLPKLVELINLDAFIPTLGDESPGVGVNAGAIEGQSKLIH
jgi:hypothetical protein